jgi:SAM-dependent methyltransferase
VIRAEYTADFYAGLEASARRSAEAIVPLVVELVRPASVVDVGCGLGVWLSVFRQLGIEDVLGIDGEHVDRTALEIPEDSFLSRDLEHPLAVARRFDLVVSLEVAEHLPPESADVFVASLAALGPVVLFSAAAPYQSGVGHQNEQWPDYWAALFAQHDYLPVDAVRRRVWSSEDVAWWYAQNTLLYVARKELARSSALQRELELGGTSQLAVVHPTRYLEWIEWGLRASGDDEGAAAARQRLAR